MTLKLLPIFSVFLILYQKHFVNADSQVPIAQEVASLKNELLWCLKHESEMFQGTTSESNDLSFYSLKSCFRILISILMN
jgi:hypothetical protein